MPRPFLLSNDEVKLLTQDYLSGLSQEQVAQRYNISGASVCGYLQRANIQARPAGPPNQPSREKIDAMCLDYQSGLSAVQVGLRHDISYSAVLNHLRREGIPARPAHAPFLYHCNEHYFDVLDTSEKAYWIGFLAADGCVNDVYATLLLVLALKIADKAHVEKLRDCLESNRKIYTSSEVATLHIRNNHICKALAQYGIVPRKSLTLKFPRNIPENLLSHYMRGYIDGDGCWQCKPPNYSLAVSSGSAPFLRMFRELLTTHCYLGMSKIYPGHIICYGGRRQLQHAIRFLYQGATVYLSRKWETVQQILHYPVNSPLELPPHIAVRQPALW